jgi:tetratricopeptide (TPR) repeat protein
MMDYDALLELGIGNLHREQFDVAVHYFRKALNRLSDDSPELPAYLAWLGLAMVQTGDEQGLVHCREAAIRQPRNPMVLCNLAKAEYFAGNRKKAFETINRGLAISPSHTELQVFAYLIDARRKPAIEFLGRNNSINRFLGRVSYSLQPSVNSAMGEYRAHS